jgi:GTPase Era involved in 16S rRNA processing
LGLSFFTSELIREALFETLKKELPYCCEVRVDEFKEAKPEDKKKISRIKATVFVERDSQKLIVIGKGGLQIKSVGMLAREKIEKFLQTKVRTPVAWGWMGRCPISSVFLHLLISLSFLFRSSWSYMVSLKYAFRFVNERCIPNSHICCACIAVKVNKDWRKKEDQLKEFGYLKR